LLNNLFKPTIQSDIEKSKIIINKIKLAQIDTHSVFSSIIIIPNKTNNICFSQSLLAILKIDAFLICLTPHAKMVSKTTTNATRFKLLNFGQLKYGQLMKKILLSTPFFKDKVHDESRHETHKHKKWQPSTKFFPKNKIKNQQALPVMKIYQQQLCLVLNSSYNQPF